MGWDGCHHQAAGTTRRDALVARFGLFGVGVVGESRRQEIDNRLRELVGGGLILIAVLSGALSLGILKNSQPADLLR